MIRDPGAAGTASTPSLVDLALGNGVPRRSFFVALVVGTLLNLINQGDALVTGAPLDYYKIGLTFIVPYCVATYGAVSAQRAKDKQTEKPVA